MRLCERVSGLGGVRESERKHPLDKTPACLLRSKTGAASAARQVQSLAKRTTGASATAEKKTTKKSAPRAPRKRRAKGGGKDLVIVESPAKARTIEGILGDKYRVIASVGHVRDLPTYGLGVDVKGGSFAPKYVVIKDKKRGVDKSEIIDEIAEAAERAEHVYLSTDPDREGEAISWHIAEAAKIPADKTQRVVFHEITKPAIEEAFKHPGKLNDDLIEAQQTRRVLDRLIGFPLTWFVQGKVARSASAGRVQSVALRQVVEREREIQAFDPQEYWTIQARLAQSGDEFGARLTKLPGQRKAEIPNEAEANGVLATLRRSDFSVKSVKTGERKRRPAPPYTTSSYQQAANNRLGYGAQRAMALAQQLYEGVELPGAGPTGLITYMRTDSLSVSPVARAEARSYATARWGADFVPEKERVYRTKARGAQEAHEAVRPTSPARTPDTLRGTLTADQLRAYTLIWQRFMASQLADARFATVAVDIEAHENAELRGNFRANAQQLVFAGHLAAMGIDATEEQANTGADADAEETVDALPALAAGDALERRAVEGNQHFTEPPPRFTEASLVKALEEQGIGRPSTYASIVQTVLNRAYVKKEGRQLVPQELGFVVNDLLVEHMDRYVAVPFTSELEEELDEIAAGERKYGDVVKGFWEPFNADLEAAKEKAVKQVEETDIVCSKCEERKMVVRWGRNGKFLGCPGFPECRNAMPLTAEGEPTPVAEPQPTHWKCPKCGSGTELKHGPYGEYMDCVKRDTDECDFRAGVPVDVACPEEPQTGQLVTKRARGRPFFGCWNYPDCTYTTNSIEADKIAPARTAEEREAAAEKAKARGGRRGGGARRTTTRKRKAS